MFEKGEGSKPEEREKAKEDLLFVLSKLLELKKSFKDEPVTPPQLVPGGRYKQDTQAEKDNVSEYKKSKFRINWFSGIISYSDVLKNYSKEFSEDEEFQSLIKEVDRLDKDLKELRAGGDKPISREMVKKADDLLDMMIKKIPKLIK